MYMLPTSTFHNPVFLLGLLNIYFIL